MEKSGVFPVLNISFFWNVTTVWDNERREKVAYLAFIHLEQTYNSWQRGFLEDSKKFLSINK